jgi:hypothetical protein
MAYWRMCATCKTQFSALRKSTLHCSPKCRRRAQKAAPATTTAEGDLGVQLEGLEAAETLASAWLGNGGRDANFGPPTADGWVPILSDGMLLAVRQFNPHLERDPVRRLIALEAIRAAKETTGEAVSRGCRYCGEAVNARLGPPICAGCADTRSRMEVGAMSRHSIRAQRGRTGPATHTDQEMLLAIHTVLNRRDEKRRAKPSAWERRVARAREATP